MLEKMVADFRSGSTTPLDVAAKCLERISLRDPQLHAWVTINRESALEQAAAATGRWQRGTPLSDLDGVPVGIKDIIDQQGMVTGLGVHGWSDCEAEKDAAIVRQLRDAGVVLMGKTESTPFACFDPAPTRNPLELACTPGGSSSGSAAGVADGHVMWALGSQTGGSITRPAAFCGIVGFKPTFGRLSLDGVFPISEHLDHLGFLCQSAADTVWIWQSLIGESATGSSVSRVADLKSVYQQRSQPEVVTAYQLAVDRISQAGIEVETVGLPDDWDEILAVHLKLMAKEAAQTHRDWFEQRRSVYPPRVSQLIERGLQVQDSEHASLLNWQKKWQQRLDEWFADGGWDALLMPSAPTTAPRDLTTTGDPSFNSPWSLSGLPTLTIPLPTATETLPSGLQLVGARGEDHRLLALGNRFERSTASMFSE